MRRRVASVVLASLLLGLAGCGGGGEDDGGADGANGNGDTAAAVSGEAVFAEAGCGGCHTFSAAGSTGATAPNLDESDVSKEDAEAQIRGGGGGMPPFEGQLTDEEIDAVAEFVSSGG